MNHDAVIQIQKVLQAIENNLEEPLDRKALIEMTYLSSAAFYPFFRTLIGTSLKDYIQRRRLSTSCRDLIHSQKNILTIALQYQYESYESYSRAFKRLTGVSPRQYRKTGILTIPYGMITIMESHAEGDSEMKRRMNQEQIQNALQAHSGILLDIDIDDFESINRESGRDAGDFVLSELPNRIRTVLQSHSLAGDVIRIHNDEFLLALPKNEALLPILVEEILCCTREPFRFRENPIQLTASIGITPYERSQKWQESVANAETALKTAKQKGKNQACHL